MGRVEFGLRMAEALHSRKALQPNANYNKSSRHTAAVSALTRRSQWLFGMHGEPSMFVLLIVRRGFR